MRSLIGILLGVLSITAVAAVLIDFTLGAPTDQTTAADWSGTGPTPTPSTDRVPIPSTATATPTTIPSPPKIASVAIADTGDSDLLVAPRGSQPLSIALDIDQTVPYRLVDGSRRSVTLTNTNLMFSHEGVTVWGVATVEVTGPDLEPETATIPATYFQKPVVLNGVRVYVAITSEFNDGKLRDGGGTAKDARLMLSDAKYTLTDLTQYRWPYPDLLWQGGSNTTYWQGIQGTFGVDAFHHGALDFGMPERTPIYAWARGELRGIDRGIDWAIWLDDAEDGRSGKSAHRILHLDEVNTAAIGKTVELGDFVGYSGKLPGSRGWWHTHIIGGYEWGPILAEAYTAHASEITRSYIKDWLVAGPYPFGRDVMRLDQDFFGDEATLQPVVGDAAPQDTTWKLWDELVPGVVMVNEALDPYPRSGWAFMNGNFVSNSAYLATYIHSEDARSADILLGTSDAVKVYLDDTEVFSFNDCVEGGLYPNEPTIIPDQHTIPVQLNAGWNRLLIKTAQRDGCTRSWQLTVRVADEEGNPIPGLVINPQRDINLKPNLLAPMVTLTEDNTPIPTLMPPTPTPAPDATPIPTPDPALSDPDIFQGDRSQPAWLYADGNVIRDGTGQEVVLRGVNIQNFDWVWYEEQNLDFENRAIPAATALSPDGWGANLITIGFSAKPIERQDEVYLQALDQMVALAKANGAYTLLAFRTYDPNGEQPRIPNTVATTALKTLAERYANDPHVLYGLQVEPHNVAWDDLKRKFVQIIDVMREVNPRALIFVPGTEWSRNISYALTDPIPRLNLVYKTHPYDAWPTIRVNYALKAVSEKFPVLLGEFGAGNSMNQDDVINLLDFAEQQGISWTGWIFHEEGCPCMLNDVATFEATEFGEEIRDRLQAASIDAVRYLPSDLGVINVTPPTGTTGGSGDAGGDNSGSTASPDPATPIPTPTDFVPAFELPSIPEPEPVVVLGPIGDGLVDALPILHADGNKIVDANGNDFTPRGVSIKSFNETWSTGPNLDFERGAIPKVTANPPYGWGANMITIGFASGPVVRRDASYLGALDEIIFLAKANGAYTHLAYSATEPGQPQSGMPNADAQQALALLAARYANENAVILGLQTDVGSLRWTHLRPRYMAMIDAIRVHNPNALIVVTGTDWDQWFYHPIGHPVPRENLVYKANIQGAWAANQDNYKLKPMARQYPLFLGQLGIGDAMELTDVVQMLDYAENLGIGWAANVFHAEYCPCLLSDIIAFTTTEYGDEIKRRLQQVALSLGLPPIFDPRLSYTLNPDA